MKVPARELSSNGSSKRGDRLPVNWPHQKVHAWAAAVLAMVSRAEGSLSRMTSSLLRVLIIVSLAVGVPAAHPRSPENCFCETWSVGNALGALGGSQNGAAFRPGSSYTGGRTRSSAGNTCVSWMQVSFRPEISPCALALALEPEPPSRWRTPDALGCWRPKNKAFPKDRGQRP